MNSTWLDRTIGWLSPRQGAQRMLARHAMTRLAYEGGRGGRRTDGWSTPGTSADAESQSITGATLLHRARDLARNNPYASAAIDVKVTETIGAGIVAEVPNKRLSFRWDAFVDNCDADGHLDLYGLQAIMERCRTESGEFLVRRLSTERSESEVRAGIPSLQIRVLEPDYLDVSRDGYALPGDDGSFARHGIQYDRFGMVQGYWLYDEHPGNSAGSSRIHHRGNQSSLVPARDVIHAFRRLRAGQTRGVTDLAPAVIRLRQVDDIDDAYLQRKLLEACIGVIYSSPEGGDAADLTSVVTDDVGKVENMYPGMLGRIPNSDHIEFLDPSSSGGYADFNRAQLRAIASGIGVPYELLTWDLSQVNYSSYRAGLMRFRRRIEQDQWHIYVPQVCRRIFEWFREEVSATAGIENIGMRTEIKWTPPRFELLDPLKETQADLEAVLAGLEPPDEVIRRRGWTMDELFAAYADWYRRIDDGGFVFKSDHRTALAAQASAEMPSEEEAA